MDYYEMFDSMTDYLRVTDPSPSFSIEATGFLVTNVPFDRMTVDEINAWSVEFKRLTFNTAGM